MFDVLNGYLFQHKSISVPGLGTIFLERVPASADGGNSSFLPPLYYFRFDKYFDAPDKDFFSYIAGERHIPDYEAIKWYNEFSQNLRSRIRLDENVKWDDVGTLTKDYAGNIVFESVPQNPALLGPVPANIVIRKDVQHQLLVGDKEMDNYAMNEWLHPAPQEAQKQTWWIIPLVVIALAIAVIIIRFAANGKNASIGNTQHIELKQ